MKQNFLILLLCLFTLSLFAVNQVPICTVCHKPLTQCQGHAAPPPAPTTCNQCGQTNCRSKNNHRKCSDCGEFDFKCPYGFNHPCKQCGQTNCRTKNNHKQCSDCGEFDFKCPYGFDHPCKQCGQTNCRTKNNHKQCPDCGELDFKCPYEFDHPCKQCGQINCRSKNNHKQCPDCGEFDFKCPYGFNHPCSQCGLPNCSIKNIHKKCDVCGKFVGVMEDACKYGGEDHHPIQTNVFTVGAVSFTMISVEADTFNMGSESGTDTEKPVHSVTISKDYYIGETEVTQALWKAVTGYGPTSEGAAWSAAYGLGDNFPAYNISWSDCQEFIKKLNQLTGQHFRMPTEAEWEFAARGGNKSECYIYSGSNTLDDVAWYIGIEGGGTHPVKTRTPNELGIYDMSGNVSEWCSDWFDTYGSSDVTDPQGPASGSYRVARGGSWSSYASNCCIAYRYSSSPAFRYNSHGFRLALSPKEYVPDDSSAEQETFIPDEIPDEQDSFVVKTFSVKGVSFTMIPVESDTFNMGSESGTDAEKPVHSVTISKDYYIGETEVTQALWKAVTGYSPTSEGAAWSAAYGLGDNFPAYNISWVDCQEFIKKLNRLTGQHFRMPTEAEWELAARGGNKSECYIYSGSNTLDDVAWYIGIEGGGTHLVKTRTPNELGIYDMSGNVSEWCSDWFDTYGSSDVTDPQGPARGSYRVARGGCWSDNASFCITTNRYSSSPAFRYNSHGFRLALSYSK